MGTEGFEEALSMVNAEEMNKFVSGEEDTPAEVEVEPDAEPEVGAEPEAEPEEEETDEGDEEVAYDIDGEKLTASQFRELKTMANKAADLEEKMSEASTEKEQLAVWREMHNLAQKYPGLRDKLAEVFSEFEKNPDALGKPIEEKELTGEEKVRDAFIQELMVERAGTEIDGLVGHYAGKYPDIIDGSDKWVREVLAPAVEKEFGTNVGPREIKMTMAMMVVDSDFAGKAEKSGAQKMANRLAKEPKGSRIVRGTSTRKEAVEPEASMKGKSIEEMFASVDIKQFIKNGQ